MWKSFFNRLLLCLAVFDTSYLLCEVSEAFRHRHNTLLQNNIFVNFVYPVRNIFMCSSIYVTVCLAYERHQALTDPMIYRIRSTLNMNKRLLKYVLFILAFTSVLYFPKFCDLNVGETFDCSNKNITNDKAKQIISQQLNIRSKFMYRTKP